MGVQLSYCVNDEVVKLVLARLSDRDPLSSRTSISGKTCGESNRSENGSATVLWCNSRGASVEGQEGWRGTRVEGRGVNHRCSLLPLDTRHSVLGNLKPDTRNLDVNESARYPTPARGARAQPQIGLGASP